MTDQKHTREPIFEMHNAELKSKLETAYNETYGKGINPAAVPDMLAACELMAGAEDDVGAVPDAIKQAKRALEEAKEAE